MRGAQYMITFVVIGIVLTSIIAAGIVHIRRINRHKIHRIRIVLQCPNCLELLEIRERNYAVDSTCSVKQAERKDTL